MKTQALYIGSLIVTISIALFAGTQIFKFFTERHVVLGAWDQDNSALVSAQEAEVGSSKLQLFSGETSKEYASQYKIETFQGYIFDMYFKSHQSPLYGYGENFVDACQKYKTPKDCTLLLAIAKVETDLCKTDISAKQFNCWGWGGSGRNRIIFTSFPQAIDTITGKLKTGYGDRFFENANNGALSYCGRHCTSYGNHVESEKRRINDFAKANGYSSLF